MSVVHLWRLIAMNFPGRLVEIRKRHGFTQQALADAVSMHVNQIKKYEAGNAQPTLSALIKLAQTLHVSIDEMVFEEGDRGPDDDLRLQFEAVTRMTDDDKKIVMALLDGMIIKHQTQKMVSNLTR